MTKVYKQILNLFLLSVKIDIYIFGKKFSVEVLSIYIYRCRSAQFILKDILFFYLYIYIKICVFFAVTLLTFSKWWILVWAENFGDVW